MTERRQQPRVLVHWKVVIAAGGHVFEGHAVDVCMGGMTLLSPNRMDEKQHCKVQFSIPGLGKGEARLVQLDAVVTNVVLAAHQYEFRVGVGFLSLAGADQTALESFLKNHFSALS
jgi:c-di-GMP-binding flagellar brake protein YcgR